MAEATPSVRNGAATIAALRSAYTAAFGAYLDDGSEATLRRAYELGRDAVTRDVGLLELAQIHHDALLAALERAERPDARLVTRAGAEFLLEALSAFEMVQRGFTEARQMVTYQRRQAAMIRQLSTLLADASLAGYAHASMQEVLQLVAEQALELTEAAWCVAHTQDVFAHHGAILTHAGSLPSDASRMVGDAYAALAAGPQTDGHVELPSSSGVVLAVPLAALDGETVGVLAVAADEQRPFGELDLAVLLHIAQMTAAAVERALRYDGKAR